MAASTKSSEMTKLFKEDVTSLLSSSGSTWLSDTNTDTKTSFRVSAVSRSVSVRLPSGLSSALIAVPVFVLDFAYFQKDFGFSLIWSARRFSNRYLERIRLAVAAFLVAFEVLWGTTM